MKKAENVIDTLTVGVVFLVGTALMFFGAMWFTNGIDNTVRFVISGTVTFLIAKDLLVRLLKA